MSSGDKNYPIRSTIKLKNGEAKQNIKLNYFVVFQIFHLEYTGMNQSPFLHGN